MELETLILNKSIKIKKNPLISTIPVTLTYSEGVSTLQKRQNTLIAIDILKVQQENLFSDLCPTKPTSTRCFFAKFTWDRVKNVLSKMEALRTLRSEIRLRR